MDAYRAHLRQRLTESEVPIHLHEGLVEYFASRRPTGSFLAAVLTNDFYHACLRADEVARWHLVDLAKFLCAYAPAPAWGSLQKVNAWLSDPEPPPEIFE